MAKVSYSTGIRKEQCTVLIRTILMILFCFITSVVTTEGTDANEDEGGSMSETTTITFARSTNAQEYISSVTSTPVTNKAPDCTDPPTFNNGHFVATSLTVNSTATAECYYGYHLKESVSATCNADQGWVPEKDPICEVMNCTDPPTFDNGHYVATSLTVNSTATAECYYGYNLKMSVSATCKANNGWVPDKDPMCEVINCGTPKNISNAEADISNGTVLNSTIVYVCHCDYNGTGDNSITCNADGNWTSTNFSCTMKAVEYGGECCESGSDKQCKTIDASCINDICLCNETYQHYFNDSCYERPLFNATDIQQLEDKNNINKLTISFNKAHVSNNCFMRINIRDDAGKTYKSPYAETPPDKAITIDGLPSATIFSYTMYAVCEMSYGSIESIPSKEHYAYTIPETLTTTELEIQSVWERNFTITVSSTKKCDKYNITITPPTTDGTSSLTVARNGNVTDYTFANLTGGMEYTVTVHSVINVNGSDVHSASPAPICKSYTRPLPVKVATVAAQFENRLDININYSSEPSSDSISFVVYIYDLSGKTKSNTTNCAKQSCTVSNLVSGTLYELRLFSVLQNRESEKGFPVQTYTRPTTPHVSITVWSEAQLEIKWTLNETSNLTHIAFGIIQNTGEHIHSFIEENEKAIALNGNHQFTNLSAGTNYEIYVYTFIEITDIGENTTHSYNLTSEGNKTINSYTRPAIPKITVTFQTENSILIRAVNTSYFKGLFVIINSDDSLPNENQTLEVNKDGAAKVQNLTIGTSYTLTVFSTIDGLNSQQNVTLNTSTVPGPPENLTIPLDTLHDDSFLITWIKPTEGNADEYCLNLNNNNTDYCTHYFNFTFGQLISGTKYSVTIKSIYYNQSSSRNITISTFTRPTKPDEVKLITIESNYITVDIPNRVWPSYNFTISSGETYNVLNDSIPYTFGDLSSGENYSISVFSVNQNLRSDRSTEKSTFTRPGSVKDISVDDQTLNESSMKVQWNTPPGHFDSFNINATCKSPNENTTMNKDLKRTEHSSFTILSPLDPGTLCNVSIITLLNNTNNQGILHSDVRSQNLETSTKEQAPDEIVMEQVILKNTSLNVTWRKPRNPNGVIRKYKLLIIDQHEHCLKGKFLYSCQPPDCIEQSENAENECLGESLTEPRNCTSMVQQTTQLNLYQEQNVTDLHPFRNYSVAIQAYTMCWGRNLTNTSRTEIGVPSKAPANLAKSEVGTSSIKLTWKHLNDLEEGNGPIDYYTIIKTYKESNCSDPLEGVPKTQSLSSMNDSILVSGLRPHWDYSFSISGSTSVGEGPKSATITIKTEESYPGTIFFSDIKNESLNDTEATIEWSPPCRKNGILKTYGLELENTDKKHVSKVNVTANITKTTFKGLYPYSNYSLTIKAYTNAGAGNSTQPFEFRTDIGLPYQPINVNAEPKSSSSLDVSWTPPYLYTGPTDYYVKAFDSANESNSYNCSIINDFNATKCLVDKLHPYWTYNVTVTAITAKGDNQSFQINGTTAEDVPGPVSLISLEAENDILKPRSIKVLWDPLSMWDKHGILTSYNITATNMNNSFQKNGTEPIKNDGTMQHSFTDIPPGYYNITLSASTKIGKGPDRWQEVKLSSGVPLIQNETKDGPLITVGHKKVNNEKKQISVQIPTETLLCLSDNGEPRKWGVIVAEDGEATGPSFRGSKSKFEANKFNNWFDIKDKDKISPYKATPDDWIPYNCPLQTKGSRRKRSVEDKFITFQIGVDNECSGMPKDQYCNGELHPGKGYRVKIFVCTDDACIETQYSEPIFTAPDLTIPIVSGVLSGLVVIAVVAVVIFLARRRKLCFAKDVGGTKGDDEENDIQMDKIERERPNAFKPGPVKLSEFPAYVEKMHRDSDLLFADAYKLLRENSPKHPMLAAEQQCSRPKNRYTDILPFDHSRVKILPTEDVEGSDYINANYIPGYVSPREYIAAQGPMTATFEDFWRMVWEQNVDTIVMLTKLVEKGRRKCDQYWPELSEPQFYGDLVVNLQSESNMSDYTIRIFEVKLKDTKKTVRHFSYLKWPDMGCPETPELLLEFVKAVRQYTNREHASKAHGPMVVHCSAGVGRTGTFIAVDILLQHVVDHDEVDIYNLVLKLRNHRLRMIQTEDQYVYTHECIKAFITTDENEEEEHLYENYPGPNAQEEENAYENTAFSKEPEK